MKVNNALLAVIFGFMLIFVFNVAYADSGPLLSTLQAEKSAQDYLDTHGYSSYKADIPGEYPNVEILAKVKVKSTGEIKWIDFGVAKADAMDDYTHKYEIIVSSAYVVDVLNPNGAKVGEIYVDGEDGSIVYTDLPDNGNSDSGDTNTTNNTSNNNTNDNQNGNWLQDLLDYLMGLLQQLWNFLIGA